MMGNVAESFRDFKKTKNLKISPPFLRGSFVGPQWTNLCSTNVPASYWELKARVKEKMAGTGRFFKDNHLVTSGRFRSLPFLVGEGRGVL
jgi:hypothetical protein